jgi:hypothetical protein
MKTGLQLVLISMMMIFANPAWSGSAVAVYTCEQNETASEADVMAAANAWLEAAKGMKGGEVKAIFFLSFWHLLSVSGVPLWMVTKVLRPRMQTRNMQMLRIVLTAPCGNQ